MKSPFQGFKTLRMTIALPIVALFTFAALAMTGVALLGSAGAVDNILIQLHRSAISLLNRELDAQFNEAVQLNTLHAKNFKRQILTIENQSERERYFTTQLESFPSAVMTYIGLPNGEFYGARRNLDGTIHIVRNNASTQGNSMYFETNTLGEGTTHFNTFENFDPRTRPWYQAAIDTKQLAFTPLYSHFVFKEPTLTISQPIYASTDQGSNSDLEAVFGVDFLMTWLSDTLKKVPLGKNGHIVIIDGSNKMVASTLDQPVFMMVDNKSVTVSITEATSPYTQAISKFIDQIPISTETTESTAFFKYEIEGHHYYIASHVYTNNNLNWRIFTLLSPADFLSQVYASLFGTALVLVAFILLFAVLAFYIAQRIVQPVKIINTATKQILAGEFVEAKTPLRRDEIGELATNFNVMGRQLINLVGNLESQVAQRTTELERINSQLKDLSNTDALTGIPNRRRFYDFATQAVSLAARSGRPLALVMIDIDWFKPYNDTYGHIAGDHCIEAIAKVLCSTVKRQIDLCARLGGEEFALLLQEMTYDQALALTEQLRSNVEKLGVPHEQSAFGVVTISCGLFYGSVDTTQNLDDIVDLADQALYTAKHKGRNRVEK